MDDPVPISALQHFLYCPRQCALIHVDQSYSENVYTMRGNRVHEKAHDSGSEAVAGSHIERAIPLYSKSLGLIGKSDVVEFLDDGTPYPVEYKAGSRKKRSADDVQLCAQALCLEEMLGVHIPEGSIYYDRSRHRRIVTFDEELRRMVQATIEAVRTTLANPSLPEPAADDRCPACSLLEICMPMEIANWASWHVDPFAVEEPA